MPSRDDELGALWEKTAQSGKKFLSGRLSIGDQRIEVVVFKNEYKKEGETTPDYRIYRSQPREQSATHNAERGQATRRATNLHDQLDEEIPF